MSDEPSSSDRAGLLYAVFLRLSPDANTNADLIPNALTSDDFASWVKIDEQIISKTIRATRHEISAIRRRPDFERVVRIEAATYETTILQQQEYLDRSGYIILPVDLGKQEQCKATSSSLDLLLGTNIEAQMIGQGSIYMWKAYLSRDQVSQAESLDGVKSVQPNLHNLNRRYMAGRYYIDPLDRENEEQCAEIGTSLVRLLGSDNFDPHISVLDGKLRKWMADLSNDQVAQVEAIQGVKGVRPIQRGRRCRLGIKSTNGLESQAQQQIRYKTQLGAPTELVSVSQPSTIPLLRDLKNYVHESHCGGQSFVYYVETGVAFKAQSEVISPWSKVLSHSWRLLKKEFRNVASQHLLTDLAIQNGDKPWFDDDDEGEDDEDMHSHGTCGAGKALGTRFGVSKKATLIVVRLHEVTSEEFEEALGLIRTDLKDHPERRKKSVVTMSLTLGRDWDEDDNLKDFTKLFQYLFDMDVPLVCISGNIEEAAPQVAGEIANLLSYDTVPFDTSDGNLVKNLKAYLQSDAASWERYPGIRVLWNGVREENNPKETVKCNGLETDRYIEREEVKHLIEDEFCPEVSSSRDLRPEGSAISRIYNMDTPNKVTLSVSLSQGDSVSDCIKYLMMTVDDCYHVDNDPPDNKGGGLTIVGDATYEVYPGSLRSPSRYGKQAGCDSTYKFTFNEYWVWGHGWASSDHGGAVKKEIKGYALLPDTWKFTYSIGEDGLGKTSGIDDFGCAGSG
ncbi:subtilisin [Fusarium circinatum]|uniref:Subtilisin n=1 Tax=Fusarium circinatum TaxID=48490 RepID=A0A8H5UGW7_FUSCI|nr:subtilisin [Fusarium circinatum]